MCRRHKNEGVSSRNLGQKVRGEVRRVFVEKVTLELSQWKMADTREIILNAPNSKRDPGKIRVLPF